MWIYYETDGDSGYYAIKLFSTEFYAQNYKNINHSAYGHIREIPVDDEVPKTIIENVKCPECDGEMVARSGQYGKFWGCKKYPNCKGTRDSMGRSKAERDAEKRASSDKTYEQESGFSFKRG